MKRYLIFGDTGCCDDHLGGLNDTIGATDSLEEAKLIGEKSRYADVDILDLQTGEIRSLTGGWFPVSFDEWASDMEEVWHIHDPNRKPRYHKPLLKTEEEMEYAKLGGILMPPNFWEMVNEHLAHLAMDSHIYRPIRKINLDFPANEKEKP